MISLRVQSGVPSSSDFVRQYRQGIASVRPDKLLFVAAIDEGEWARSTLRIAPGIDLRSERTIRHEGELDEWNRVRARLPKHGHFRIGFSQPVVLVTAETRAFEDLKESVFTGYPQEIVGLKSKRKRLWSVADAASFMGVSHGRARRLLVRIHTRSGGKLLRSSTGANRGYTFWLSDLVRLEPAMFAQAENLEARLDEMEEELADLRAAVRRIAAQVGENTRGLSRVPTMIAGRRERAA